MWLGLENYDMSSSQIEKESVEVISSDLENLTGIQSRFSNTKCIKRFILI